MAGIARLDFPPGHELRRQHGIVLALEEREFIVRQVVGMLAQMEGLGVSPAGSGRRLQLRAKLHFLATRLWLDGPEKD